MSNEPQSKPGIVVTGSEQDLYKLVYILNFRRNPPVTDLEITRSLQKSLRRYPDAQITDRKPIGAPDTFLAEIKRGRKSTVFCLSMAEIAQAADKLDELISARLTTTMLRN